MNITNAERMTVKLFATSYALVGRFYCCSVLKGRICLFFPACVIFMEQSEVTHVQYERTQKKCSKKIIFFYTKLFK